MVPDRMLSGRHARFNFEGGDGVVETLGYHDWTFMNVAGAGPGPATRP